jgi:hypothetical protein
MINDYYFNPMSIYNTSSGVHFAYRCTDLFKTIGISLQKAEKET